MIEIVLESARGRRLLCCPVGNRGAFICQEWGEGVGIQRLCRDSGSLRLGGNRIWRNSSGSHQLLQIATNQTTATENRFCARNTALWPTLRTGSSKISMENLARSNAPFRSKRVKEQECSSVSPDARRIEVGPYKSPYSWSFLGRLRTKGGS
jgi:hypothetical protein